MSVETTDRTLFDEQPKEQHGRWQFLFSWTGLLFVGWVIYELTSEANLAVVVICCKLGWEDFLTAVWLRRRDPIKARGKMSFWIFTASGLWKTALTATIIMFIVALGMGPNPQARANPQPPRVPAEFQQAVLTAMIGVLLSTLATCSSLGLAVWHKQKIWLDGSIHWARRYNEWPPAVSAGKNEASTLMKVAIVIFSITAFGPVLFLVILAAGAAGIEINEIVGVVIVMIMLVALPTALFVLAAYLKRNFLASRSDECWPPGEGDFADTDKLW